MMTETMPAAEKKGLLRETLEKAGKAADVAVDARLLKKRLENAVEEAKFDAQRMARRGKYAMEEALEGVDADTHVHEMDYDFFRDYLPREFHADSLLEVRNGPEGFGMYVGPRRVHNNESNPDGLVPPPG